MLHGRDSRYTELPKNMVETRILDKLEVKWQILEEISVGDKKIDKPLHTQEFPEQKMFGTGGVEGKRMKCAYSVLTFLGVPLLECLETRLKGP